LKRKRPKDHKPLQGKPGWKVENSHKSDKGGPGLQRELGLNQGTGGCRDHWGGGGKTVSSPQKQEEVPDYLKRLQGEKEKKKKTWIRKEGEGPRELGEENPQRSSSPRKKKNA